MHLLRLMSRSCRSTRPWVAHRGVVSATTAQEPSGEDVFTWLPAHSGRASAARKSRCGACRRTPTASRIC